jgi:hypothetical protein
VNVIAREKSYPTSEKIILIPTVSNLDGAGSDDILISDRLACYTSQQNANARDGIKSSKPVRGSKTKNFWFLSFSYERAFSF